jgi:fructose-specific phosphotransferase system IIC component
MSQFRAQMSAHRQYLLTGVSYVVPFIACGGILIAASIALSTAYAPMTPTGPDFTKAPAIVSQMLTVGEAAFKLFPAVLAGFIAYGMAGRPGLVPGFVGGFIAALPQTLDGKSTNAGFLGAILIGLIAGHLVNALKRLPVPSWLQPVRPIIIIPVLSGLPVGVLMLTLNLPLARIMLGLQHALEGMQSGSQVALGLVLGAMIAFDMGGPVNKAAFFFGAAMIQQGNYAVMGACAAAICTPPLGLGLATIVGRKYWTQEERESGLAALGMGLIGITEGAIPFAAADPVRVIPTIMLGSMVAAMIALLAGVGDHAPHGGPIVLPVVDHRLMYVLAILAGTGVTALVANTLRRLTDKPPAKEA